MTSNNDEALNFYGYSSYEQLEQALLEKGYGLDDVSVRIESMRQDYEQQKHDALERVVHKKEIRTIKMEELRSEVEQLKEGQILCVLNLDAHGVVQNANIVSMGTVNQTVSSPREIFNLIQCTFHHFNAQSSKWKCKTILRYKNSCRRKECKGRNCRIHNS